jgi:hypothetical protein
MSLTPDAASTLRRARRFEELRLANGSSGILTSWGMR